VGWTGIARGVALVANVCWLIVLSPLRLALVHFTARAEERELETCFDDTYRAYLRRVRRYR
jgi:protein-S-isoprenylcysteine O-methyltransferase Ste14